MDGLDIFASTTYHQGFYVPFYSKPPLFRNLLIS